MSAAGGREQLEQLARRAAEGDELAFGRLAREIRPQLYRWALVQTGDADDAEDITQAALLRVHRSLSGFHFRARLSTWLYAVVRSAAADWRRAARRRSGRQRSYASAHLRDVQSAQDSAEPRLLRFVRDALRGLPARQREIFDLAELQGTPCHTVAERLGLSDSTVRVHLLRARRTIRARVLAGESELPEQVERVGS